VTNAGMTQPAPLRCSTQSRRRPIMQVKTRIKAGGLNWNHNETLVRAPSQAQGLKVKTRIKAGGVTLNHNETLVRAQRPATGLKVKTRIKAGGLSMNHNETLVRSTRRKRSCA
jgi:hypothetical protein